MRPTAAQQTVSQKPGNDRVVVGRAQQSVSYICTGEKTPAPQKNKSYLSMIVTHQALNQSSVCFCHGAYSLTFPSYAGKVCALDWPPWVSAQSGELPNDGQQWE